MAKILGAFDFDCTIVQENSDIVAKNLLSSKAIKERLKLGFTRGWTGYMDDVFRLLLEEGISIEKLRDAVTKISPVPDFVSLFKNLNKNNCDIIIISDSNTYFIDEWLKSAGIRELVHTIYSNPGQITDGRLHIKPYHQQDWCQLSTENLCKGHILRSHIDQEECNGTKYRKTFYVGDGRNDLCPSLKLNDGDYVFPRRGFRLIDELNSAGKEVKASVIPWENTNQIWAVVQNF